MSIKRPWTSKPTVEPTARGVQIDTGTYIGRQDGKATFWLLVHNEGDTADEWWVLSPEYVEPTTTASAESEFVLTSESHDTVDEFQTWLEEDQGVSVSEAAVWQHSATLQSWS